jgi:hypothetical protein
VPSNIFIFAPGSDLHPRTINTKAVIVKIEMKMLFSVLEFGIRPSFSTDVFGARVYR